jgi:hypothetical protein
VRFTVRLLAVLLESVAGFVALVTSSLFGDFSPRLSQALRLPSEYHAPAAAAVLLILALVLVVMPRRPRAGIYTVLVVIASLPSLLPFSAINWPAIMEWAESLTTRLNHAGIVVVMMTIAAAHITIVASSVQGDLDAQVKLLGRAKSGLDDVSMTSHRWAAGVLGAAVACAGIVLVVSYLIGRTVTAKGEILPIGILLLGIAGAALLIGAVHELSIRGKKKIGSEDR